MAMAAATTIPPLTAPRMHASPLAPLPATWAYTLARAQAALKAMDVGAKGVVRLSDFVAWWTGKATQEGSEASKAGAAA